MKRLLYILALIVCSTTAFAQEQKDTIVREIKEINDLKDLKDLKDPNNLNDPNDPNNPNDPNDLNDLKDPNDPNDLNDLNDPEDIITIGELLDSHNTDTKALEKQLTPAFIPSPKKAMWLGIVLPGAGQIYNRKFWKLPLIYGGMVGCVYAWRWNNMMYTDYSRAYLDLMDDDPNTQSYNSFMHLGAQITDANRSRYENIFKRRKDFYRRYRDMSIFCLIGVYALSVVDAYVDASLSQFDISKDLSLRIEPAVIKSNNSNNPLDGNSLGVNLGLTF